LKRAITALKATALKRKLFKLTNHFTGNLFRCAPKFPVNSTLGIECHFMKKCKYILNLSNLEIGDIILTTQQHPVSKAIKFATSSNYSHAMLYVGHCSCIHSTADGVHSINPQTMLFENTDYVKVLRVLPIFNRELVEKACFLARTQIGKEYTRKEAIKTISRSLKRKDKDRQFCSRLIGRSYENAGIKLVRDCNYCSPQDFSDSEHTYVIKDFVKLASEEEIAFAKKASIVDKQQTLTNHILKKAREIAKEDIQTIEQLTACVIARNELDFKITKLIKESGYLEMADHDIKENPWRYEVKQFNSLNISTTHKIDLARTEIESAKQRYKRFYHMYELHTRTHKDFNLEYTSMWLELYEKLLHQTNTTLSVFKEVLAQMNHKTT
jgi:hypothetical protein